MSNENDLTDAERELEAALRSLQVTPARINVRAAALATTRRRATVRLGRWRMTIAAAAIALAGSTWMALASRERTSDTVLRQAPVIKSPVVPAEVPVEPPTLLVYRRALAHSPAKLEALLDRHALAGSAPTDRSVPVIAPTVWNAYLHPSLGEM